MPKNTPDNKGMQVLENLGSDDELFDVLNNEPNNTGSEQQAKGDESSDDFKEKYENLKARYESSSQEAKRLNQELEQRKQYDSFIQEVESNPALQEHVKKFYNNQQNPTADLPEDFVFDADEAIKNPDSIHGKLFNQMLEQKASKLVEERLGAYQQQQQATQTMEQVKNKLNLSDEQVNEIQDWAKNRKASFEDVANLYLFEQFRNHPDKFQKPKPKPKANDFSGNFNKMSQFPPSVNGNGEKSSADQSFQDFILGKSEKNSGAMSVLENL